MKPLFFQGPWYGGVKKGVWDWGPDPIVVMDYRWSSLTRFDNKYIYIYVYYRNTTLYENNHIIAHNAWNTHEDIYFEGIIPPISHRNQLISRVFWGWDLPEDDLLRYKFFQAFDELMQVGTIHFFSVGEKPWILVFRESLPLYSTSSRNIPKP